MSGEHPEWLPVDWKVCVRVRNYGRKDKYYINPLNGLKFNSKPDVLRYLKNAGTEPTLNELTKIDIEKAVPEEVAPGWIEEIRIKRKGGKTRREPSTVRANSKGQRSAHEKADNILTDGNGSVNTSDVPRAKYVEQSDIGADTVAADLPDKLPQVDAKIKHQFGTRRNTRSAHSKLKNIVTDDHFSPSGSKVAAVEDTNLQETNAVENSEKKEVSVAEDCQHEKVIPENKRKKSNKCVNSFPRRTSRRLASAEADPSPEVKTSKQALAARLQSDEAEIITTENKANAMLSDKPETSNTSEDFRNYCEAKTEVPTKNNNQKERESVGFDMKEDEKKLESSLDDLLMDPCIEFAIKTLTGAIPIEDVVIKVDESSVSSPHPTSGCSSLLASGDIWADPCFEFAVKMLTDEIPVGPLSSSGTVGCNDSPTISKVKLDNLYTSSTHSFGQFDGVTKPYAWQQGVRNPSLPRTATNGGGGGGGGGGSSQSIDRLKGNCL